MTTLIYYMKGHYYMLKHKVFSHFDYRCSCCGSDYIEDLGPSSPVELYILGWLDREGIKNLRDWRS